MSFTDRRWMYKRLLEDRMLNIEFVKGVDIFIEFATRHPHTMNNDEIRCPCVECANRYFCTVNVVKLHLYKEGFVPKYLQWYRHGEPYINTISGSIRLNVEPEVNSQSPPMSPMRQMIFDVAGPTLHVSSNEEEPNAEAKQFFDMLAACDEELWPGSEHSVMSALARLLNMKSEHSFSEKGFDNILELFKETLPADNKLPANFYETKRLIRGLGLPVEKIDCCLNGCMLYWKLDANSKECQFCGEKRYKYKEKTGCYAKRKLVPQKRMYYFPITPRLKRLFYSRATAEHMTWHHKHVCDDGEMGHPSDSEAWRHFNETHPSFADEPRNVRLALCSDGFNPFGQSGKQYSCWPIILTPYNLPPWMCMKEPYMFLTALAPGPNSPKQRIDVYMQPLVEELKQLWDTGVTAYDVSVKQNFLLKAALLWTISDFPAYAMLSGWSTHGCKACPWCMEDTQAFQLTYGGKPTWFDCHRRFLRSDHPYRRNKTKFRKNRVELSGPPKIKTGVEILADIERSGLLPVTCKDAESNNLKAGANIGWKKKSILWDLPYWKTNLIRHNLDVMHIEKNVFDNVFNTLMNIPGKTKDNAKARDDMCILCRRPELAQNPSTGKYPKAVYCLDRPKKKAVCDWVKTLKFPDGYVSNLGRCIDEKQYKLFGMKSHDCHVFMQRLLPIAFRELLPRTVWEAITELSVFFKSLTSSQVTVDEMEKLEKNIVEILCKLETIFPPGMFDSMEHLPVHLPHEAKIAGPVQYRWMYPFERYLRHLKQNVKNKARVEGSIANAYLLEEASTFFSHYFEPNVYTRARKVPRNDEGDAGEELEGNLTIFIHPGRLSGKAETRWLTNEELKAAHTYILLNCEEIIPYMGEYITYLEEIGVESDKIQEELEKHFSSWFLNHVNAIGLDNHFVCALAHGPLRRVKSYPIYFTNGYRFHTNAQCERRGTFNSGVCINGDGVEYFGNITEILELEFQAMPIKRTVLFKCDWYDTSFRGTRVDKSSNITEVNTTRKLNVFEPFILAKQAIQVYYMSYPSLNNSRKDWKAVVRVKAKGSFKIVSNDDAFQEKDAQVDFVNHDDTNDIVNLSDPTANPIVLPEEEEAEPEPELESESEEEFDDTYVSDD